MRVYAATVTFLIVFSMLGLKSLLGLIFKPQEENFQKIESQAMPAMVFGIVLAIVTIGGVLLVKSIAKPQSLSQAECSVGETLMIVRFTPGSLVQVGGEAASQRINVTLEQFTALNEGYPEMHDALVQTVGEAATLARPLDLLSMQYPLLVVSDQLSPAQLGLYSICAIQAGEEALASRGWWNVKSIIK